MIKAKKLVSLLAWLWFTLNGLQAYAQQNGVLHQGTWVRMAVLAPGVYKVTGQQLRQQGFGTTQLSSQRLNVYGFGGGMLPQANNVPAFTDLPVVACQVVDGGDGQVDNEDYLLFYAQGPDLLGFSANGTPQYQNNVYADTTWYYVGSQAGSTPARVAPDANTPANTAPFSTFDQVVAHEQELKSIIGSGRQWFGQEFSFENNQTVSFTIPGLINAPIQVVVNAMSQAFVPSSFTVSVNQSAERPINFTPLIPGTYRLKGDQRQLSFALAANEWVPNGNQLNVNLRFGAQGGGSRGYLDYVYAVVRRQLSYQGEPLIFQNLQSLEQPVSAYQISNAPAGLTVWNITQPLSPQAASTLTLQNGQARFSSTNLNALEQFVAFSATQAPAPAALQAVANQNLQALAAPQMLIISHPAFIEAANTLAQHRQSHSGLSTQVVNVQHIYHAFASGMPDLTAIRNFIKYQYQQPGSPLQYVLFMGKASYDYKNILGQDLNFVPTYESRNSLHPVNSYASDDYFGFMEANEGEWIENRSGDHDLELGIGRLPVKTAAEAQAMVQKIIHYETAPGTFGAWRQRLVFVADDEDNNVHQRDAEILAQQITQRFGQFNAQRIYIDAFEQPSTANGESAPQVNEAITRAVQNGSLIVNYTGHGGEVGWAAEGILNVAMVRSWRNYDQLPLFVTATCEFGRHEDPERISGAEYLVLNARGGAIGLLTTARPVTSFTNFLVNRSFFNYAFPDSIQNGGTMPRLGDVLRQTKNNNLVGTINRNFLLLGDPAMRLNYPGQSVGLTSINGQPAQDFQDTVRALDVLQLSGQVYTPQGNVDAAFNGHIEVSMLDKAQQISTRGTDQTPYQYQARNNLLFKGRATVQNGRFSLTIPVPKNIFYQVGQGLLSFYAWDEETQKEAGAFKDFTLGQSNPTAATEQVPPAIELFLNDSLTQNNSALSNPLALWARLTDQSGINLATASPGKALAVRVNNGPWQDAGPYFVYNTNSYRQGWLQYPLNTLAPGQHTLTVQAFDIHHNRTERSLTFFVDQSAKPAIQSVSTVPNPFSQNVTFRIRHNRTDQDLQLTLSVYNRQGQQVYQHQQNYLFASNPLPPITWQPSTTQGKGALTQGLYFYRLVLTSQSTGASATYSGRLVHTY